MVVAVCPGVYGLCITVKAGQGQAGTDTAPTGIGRAVIHRTLSSGAEKLRETSTKASG